MDTKTSSKHMRKKRFLTGSLLFVLITLTVIGLYSLAQSNHGCNWTGLGECRTSKQPDEEVRLAKTMWDWLEILIVPVVLIVAGFLVNGSIQKSERISDEHHAQLEREIAEDRLRETALQTYLDKMSDLLLDRQLHTSSETDEVRAVARSRTLTVLRGLDGSRRAMLLVFLRESNLINVSNVIVDLQGAQFDDCALKLVDLADCSIESASLRGAVLSQCLLSNANLTEVDFNKASLRNTDMRNSLLFRANLSEADLTSADLRGADLRFANLHGAKLVDARLESANLNQADLSLSDFTGATVTKKQINACISIAGAIMPVFADEKVHDQE